MPLVKVEITTGKSAAYKKALLDGIHNALVETIKIPDSDRRQRLYELDELHFERTGRSDQYMIIEITMFKGRSFQAKRALYSAIVRNLEAEPGIPGNEISIVIHEPPLENWGIRGGKPASELDLGFNINV
jgi:phenylpyruvate tautomerase PptA (4-oxalocrotonate tautomerase family)